GCVRRARAGGWERPPRAGAAALGDVGGPRFARSTWRGAARPPPPSTPDPAAPAPSGLRLTSPGDLPVSQRREDIQAAIRENQVVVIAGATGSCKTTQIPKMLLELGYGGRGKLKIGRAHV